MEVDLASMSVTKHIVCTTCKRYIWIGQGGHIYTADDYIERLTEFLLVTHASSTESEKHVLLSVDEHEYGDGLLAGCVEEEQ